MGLYAARFRFSGKPPSIEEIDERLRVEGGEPCTLAGCQRDGTELIIFTSISAFAPAYATKVLREMGGVELDFDTGEPVDKVLLIDDN